MIISSSCLDHKDNNDNQEVDDCRFRNTDSIFWDESNEVVLDTLFYDVNGDLIRRKIEMCSFKTITNENKESTVQLELRKKWKNKTLIMERIVGNIPLDSYQFYFQTLRDSVLPKSMNLGLEKPYSNLKSKNCEFRFYSNKLNAMGFYETRVEVYLN
jgi:hypothetical protein